MGRDANSGDALDVALLVLPHASLLSVASTLDPLRAANRHLGRPAFRWTVVSPGLAAVPLTCGLSLPASPDVGAARGAGLLLVVAGFRVPEVATRSLLGEVRALARICPVLGAVDSGAWVLAKAGLLDGHRATTHWEDLEDFSAAHPAVDVVPDRYVVTPTRMTAGGAGPACDMMIDLVRRRHGAQVAREVAGSFITAVADGARPQRDAEPAPDPRLARVVAAMEASVDAPRPVAALAREAGLSPRRLEGLFQAAYCTTPGAFFLEMRLQSARRLVADTRHPLAEVALRAGFSSPATFARAMRRRWGVAPSALRRAVTSADARAAPPSRRRRRAPRP